MPLPNITKSNRKDCRACRKAKCERVGMTAMPKDRPSRTAASKAACKSSSIIVNDLLEQLARDLAYDHPLTSSSALESLLRLIDLPSFNPLTIDSHSVYMNAVRIWSNQYNHALPPMSNVALTDTFAVLLFLFHTMMSTSDYDEDKSSNNSKFDKLVSILQQEIQRLTGADQRSACRIKALFMKSYVALAQYPNSTNLLENNNLAQAPFLPYQQYPLYGQWALSFDVVSRLFFFLLSSCFHVMSCFCFISIVIMAYMLIAEEAKQYTSVTPLHLKNTPQKDT